MLDTNAASTLIRGHASAAFQSLLVERDACISVITEAELRFGVRRRPDATRLARAVEGFLRGIPILPWTSATAQAYAELRTRMEIQGIGLSAMDLLIATHALAEQCTLISADRAFAQVQGLRLFDWSASSVSGAVTGPVRHPRDKSARMGIVPGDAAAAHAQSTRRHTAQKMKLGKKPKAK
jgi:tRNA(fMet)-specific endonuclease VapC